jgi:hypothetical protein
MSTRAIGSAVGVSEATVRREIAGASFSRGDDAPPERRVVGTDGKTYARPAPQPPSTEDLFAGEDWVEPDSPAPESSETAGRRRPLGPERRPVLPPISCLSRMPDMRARFHHALVRPSRSLTVRQGPPEQADTMRCPHRGVQRAAAWFWAAVRPLGAGPDIAERFARDYSAAVAGRAEVDAVCPRPGGCP